MELINHLTSKVKNATQIEGSWNSSFWSGTDVEVSLANPRYVWAGGYVPN